MMMMKMKMTRMILMTLKIFSVYSLIKSTAFTFTDDSRN